MKIEQELERLKTMSSAELQEQWRRLDCGPVPKVSNRMLRLALAWEIQAKIHGGLSRDTVRKLEQLSRGLTKTMPARAGMRLVREWQGQAHVVTVDEDEVIRWQDREYRSLSEVARAITGTRWSGPAFFGLKKRAA